MRKRYDSDGDDCAAALALPKAPDMPVTLSASDADAVMAALREADALLARTERSKVYRERTEARSVRQRVTAAWGVLSARKASATAQSEGA